MMRLATILWIGAILALGVQGAGGQTMSGPARVVDGDTLHIDGYPNNIRLERIDTPETHQTCENARGSTYPCGVMAADRLRSLIGSPPGTCEASGFDGYGRPLATCSVGKLELNAAMVVSGWAVEFDRYSDGRYAGYEEEAKTAGVGLWQGKFVMPWEWRDRKRQEAAEQPVSSSGTDCEIKGNISRNGRIYHMPGQADYDRVRISEGRGERYFCSEEEAQAAGWRRAER